MIKTLQTVLKQDKERFRVPHSVQQAIPVSHIWPDGIFKAGGKYSKMFRFTDINYAVASKNDKESMFLSYSELLNSLDSGAATSIIIQNRRINKTDFERDILFPMKGDEQDAYRKEYNKILLDKATGTDSMIQHKFVTVSVFKRNIEDARAYFARIGADLTGHFGRLGSACAELNADERLRVLHSFFHPGEESNYFFDMAQTVKLGHDFKDCIATRSIEFRRDYFKMGGKFGRVIFLRDYAAFIKDSMVTELCDLNRNLMLNLSLIPVPSDEAVREVENRLLGVETNISNWQRRQNKANNFSAVIPYDMEQQRKESREFLDDLVTRDQRMLFGLLTLVHTADSKEQLDADTETLLTTARKHLCNFAPASFQQLDGLNSVLPYGLIRLKALRTLTTESTAVFMPFRAQEINHNSGVFYGLNAISRNPIICDRRQLLNSGGFITGVSGSGKSMAAKNEISYNFLSTDDDVIVIDPESEYTPLIEAFGGQVCRFAPDSKNRVNALDMSREYGAGENPLMGKSDFLLSLCAQLMGAERVSPNHKSIIDRCVKNIYRDYIAGGYKGTPPTLQDFRHNLMEQPQQEAADIALALELFTEGTLNIFAHQTNVDLRSRIISFDIRDLGKNLKDMGLSIVTEFVLNRVALNRALGKRTHVLIDEIYLFFANQHTSNFFEESWRRFRKQNCSITGVTQMVDECLKSDTARAMFSNSEFLLMHSTAATDRPELAKLLSISPEQLSYITNSKPGRGLIKVGAAIVPFINEFPTDTALYRLMTTKPGE